METMEVMFLIGLSFLVGAFVIISAIPEQESMEEMTKEQWASYVQLGWAPNSPPRESTEFDYDTGVIISNGDKQYKLFHSRTIKSRDFGGTFVEEIK